MKCKCGSGNFVIMIKRNSAQKGLYCSDCGKWIKWLGKDEYNFMLIKGIKEIKL